MKFNEKGFSRFEMEFMSFPLAFSLSISLHNVMGDTLRCWFLSILTIVSLLFWIFIRLVNYI